MGAALGNQNHRVHEAEFIENARYLWDKEGLSAVWIGHIMGVNKNVIIGIAHRNHFKARPSPLPRDTTS